MKLIVGLGNIGREYEDTRHNVGFMVADVLAARWGLDKWREADCSVYAEYRSPEKVFLLKPTTYMNLSGFAVEEFASFYHIEPEDIAIIQDDLDLPCGRLRIRRKGSAGGHNGLKSIIAQLGSQDFPRFKIGIGHPEGRTDAVIKHVLQRFSGKEEEIMEKTVARTADALVCWLQEGVEEAMQRYNKVDEDELS